MTELRVGGVLKGGVDRRAGYPCPVRSDAPFERSKPVCPFCGRKRRERESTCAHCRDLPALCPTYPVAN